MITRWITLVAIVVAVCFAAWLTPVAKTHNNMTYGQIRTDDVQTFPTQASADRTFCAEMVSLPQSDELKDAVAVFGRTLWPTPPPRYVWVNKRTSPSGEGNLACR